MKILFAVTTLFVTGLLVGCGPEESVAGKYRPKARYTTTDGSGNDQAGNTGGSKDSTSNNDTDSDDDTDSADTGDKDPADTGSDDPADTDTQDPPDTDTPAKGDAKLGAAFITKNCASCHPGNGITITASKLTSAASKPIHNAFKASLTAGSKDRLNLEAALSAK